MASFVVHRLLSDGLYTREATAPPLMTIQTLSFLLLAGTCVAYGVVLGAHALACFLANDSDAVLTSALSPLIIMFHHALPFGSLSHLSATMNLALGDTLNALRGTGEELELLPCASPVAASQQWAWGAGRTGLTTSNATLSLCVSTRDGDKDGDEELVAIDCGGACSCPVAALWSLRPDGTLRTSSREGKCAQGAKVEPVELHDCDPHSEAQRWAFNPATQQLVSGEGGGAWCLSVPAPGAGARAPLLDALRAFAPLPPALLPVGEKAWASFFIAFALSPLFLFAMLCFAHHLNASAADRGALNWVRDLLTHVVCLLTCGGAPRRRGEHDQELRPHPLRRQADPPRGHEGHGRH